MILKVFVNTCNYRILFHSYIQFSENIWPWEHYCCLKQNQYYYSAIVVQLGSQNVMSQ